MEVQKLTNSEFNRLLPLILPPKCEVSNLIITVQKRSLTGCQLATLLLATAISFRFNTDKQFACKVVMIDEFKRHAPNMDGDWHLGRSFYK
jgi:hypothetical protein